MAEEVDVSEQLKSLVKLGPWLKIVIAGAFTTGIWVATLQIQVTHISAELSSIKEETKDREKAFTAWKEEVITKTTEIKTRLDGVDKGIQEIKDAIKEIK